MYGGECGDSRHGDGAWVESAGGPHRAQKCDRRHRHIGEDRRIAEPIAPTHRKAKSFAESTPRIDSESTRLGEHRGELGHGNGAHERVETPERPKDHDERAISERCSHGTGQPQDADADHSAKDKRKTEAQSENSSQGALGFTGHFNARSHGYVLYE